MTTANYQPRTITPSRRAAILHEDAVCHWCGSWEPSEVDHIIPWSRGGSDDDENLVPACNRCNAEKKDLTPDEWREMREMRGWPWPPPSWQSFAFSLSDRDHDELRRIADKAEASAEWVWSAIAAHRRGEKVPAP